MGEYLTRLSPCPRCGMTGHTLDAGGIRCECGWYLGARRWPANPWAGRHPCPQCGSSAWTLPYHPESARWRCVKGRFGGCGVWFTPEQMVTEEA